MVTEVVVWIGNGQNIGHLSSMDCSVGIEFMELRHDWESGHIRKQCDSQWIYVLSVSPPQRASNVR